MDSNDFTSDNNTGRINKKLCPDIKKMLCTINYKLVKKCKMPFPSMVLRSSMLTLHTLSGKILVKHGIMAVDINNSFIIFLFSILVSRLGSRIKID